MATISMPDDLLNLSTFKCKVCFLRLHNPVMQVDEFGNICGSCFHRGVYTNVTQNEEVEALLSKLYVSCRYAERDCTFDGFYSKIWKHEEICSYREMLCPFFYEHKCEDFVFIRDILDHIREKHIDSILVGESNSVLVDNPTEECPKACYLLVIDDKHFLLKTNLKMGQKRGIIYSLYHFDSDTPSKNCNSSLIIKHGDSAFKINRDVYITHVSETELRYRGDNVWESPQLKLKSFNVLKTVEISVVKRETENRRTCNVKGLIDEVFMKCPKCKNIVSECYTCVKCKVNRCSICSKRRCCDNASFIQIKNTFATEFKCKSCHQMINGYEYDLHENYLCKLKKFKCTLNTTCTSWIGSLEKFRAHMQGIHGNFLNQNVHTIDSGVHSVLCFIKGHDFFVQNYSISDGDLTVSTMKLTPPHYDDSYTWEVHIKGNGSVYPVIVYGDCSFEGHKQTVNVQQYLENETKLTYNTYIKHV